MSGITPLEVWSEQAKTCLERLSNLPEAQIAYLEKLGVADLADELALEFDGAFRPLAPLLEEIPEAWGLLSALRRVDSALSVQDLQWEAAALTSSPSLAKIRRLASSALDEAWPD